MDAVARKYQGRVEFLFIYVRESHPDQGLPSAGKPRDRTPIRQPATLEERTALARRFCEEMRVTRRILVDDFGQRSVQRAYGGRDNPTIVLDRDGIVALKMQWTKGDLLDGFLQKFLAAGGKADRALAEAVAFRGPGYDPLSPKRMAEMADEMTSWVRPRANEKEIVRQTVLAKIEAWQELRRQTHELEQEGQTGGATDAQVDQAVREFEAARAAYQKKVAELDRRLAGRVSVRTKVSLLARGILDNGLGFMPPMGGGPGPRPRK
jgi:hypothetical protein